MQMLTIIIVSYNTKDLLRTCLSSLYGEIHATHLLGAVQVIIVDNASGDGSIEMVRNDFPSVQIIQQQSNTGYAKANNIGMSYASEGYVLLLNSDTQIQSGALRAMLKRAELFPKIGALGPRLLNLDGSIQSSAGYFPLLWRVACWMLFFDDIPGIGRLLGEYHVESSSWYLSSHEVDWVSGACLLTTVSCIKDVGVLDDQIFMYGEEVEWCFRMKQKGYTVLYESEAQVIHSKGASSEEGGDAGIAEEFRSMVYFYRKHMPFWQQWIVRRLLFLGAWSRILIFGIIGRYRQRRLVYEKALSLVR